MDLKFTGVPPTDAERAAVDGLLGPPQSTWEWSSWHGGGDRTAMDVRVAIGGDTARSRRHLLLPALAEVQSEIGWISAGALDYICQRLTVPPADAYGVATFYALLSTTERPAKVAHVCDDVGCRAFGALAMLAELGERDDIVPSPCLGQCDRAPAVLVQRAGQADVTLTSTDAATVASVLAGNAPAPEPARSVIGGSGPVLARVGSVDPTSLDSYREAGGYEALDAAVAMGGSAVIAELKASNLKGRGGAAFPTGVKWDGAANQPEGDRYFICNADESEPGTFKDRVVMEEDPFALIEAMTIGGYATGARHGYIYIRGEYPVATERLHNAITTCRNAGLLGDDVGGQDFAFDIELRKGQGAYICGEETALFNSIEGYRGEPRQKPPFPTEAGLFGKPTVVNNVETLINVLPIVVHGGTEFATVGTADSTGTRLFCLSGNVSRPGVYEAPFGVTLRELFEMAGGIDGDLAAILLGGAAGSFVGPDSLDVPLTFEDTRQYGATLGSGVVMAFDTDTNFADISRRIAAFFRDESCGQCVPCRVGTVRQEEVLARHLVGGEPVDSDLLAEIAGVMADASICGLGHTAAGAVRSAIALGLVGAT